MAVTRPLPFGVESGDDRLGVSLAELGAEVVHLPLIRIDPPDTALDSDVRPVHAGIYDWVVFTSANAVRALVHMGAAPRLEAASRVAAVGPATARAVEQLLGWTVHLVPGRYAGGSVASAMADVGMLRGQRVLWPRPAAVQTDIGEELRKAGAIVTEPVVYVTRENAEAARALVDMILAGDLDVITFTSPSAVRALGAAGQIGDRVAVAVIGPATAEAVRQAGSVVHVQPETHTVRGLVEAMVLHMAAQGGTHE